MTFSLKGFGRLLALAIVMLIACSAPAAVFAQEPAAAAEGTEAAHAGGEVNIVLPDLDLTDVGGYSGRTLLMGGLLVSFLGMLFGLVILNQLKNLPVHRSMAEVSSLIYETCKTYLITQGKFIAILEIFIAVVIVLDRKSVV